MTDDEVSEKYFASLDIGSHTTRMLIVRKEGSQLVPVRTERRVTRLAQGFLDDTITEKAQHRNISALEEYISILKEFQVAEIACGATGVVRRAKNSSAVLYNIAAETGIECQILSEQSEALLAATGILSVIPETGGNLLTFDIGGGSTEFVLTGAVTPPSTSSRPVGAATLTEAFLKGDPPGTEAVCQAVLSARNEIMLAKEQLYENLKKTGTILFLAGLRLVGTAGTVTTLAAMHMKMARYVPYRVNGMVLERDWLSNTIESLAQMPLAERRLIAGLEAGREDIILGGAVIVSEILSCFGHDSFVVSDAGLLEGLLIELIEKESAPSSGKGAALRTSLTWRLQKG